MSDSPLAQASLAERLQDVHVGVRDELQVSRHVFSNEPWYVIRDPVTFASHRLSRDDYQIFTSLRSDRTLDVIFADQVARGSIASNQMEDFYRFVIHLNQLGLLNLPVSDGKNLYARFARRTSAERRAKILGALFLRVPLAQPNGFLDRTVRCVKPLFTRTAFTLWLICLVCSGLLVIFRFDEFRSPLGTMLVMQNLPLIWVLLIGLKVLHEFGHAYACKRFGGQVPEMGAFFILFTPCAYVDASAAWGFPSRLHRIIVSLAGMYFESIAAMVALAAWSLTGPGIAHSTAQYVIILSTLITVGFNINPLMKFDGYYVLSDLLGRPNLRQEAMSQAQTALKRMLLGIRAQPAADSRYSGLSLAVFGIAAALYKATVLLGISMIIATKIPIVGLGVAATYMLSTLWQLTTKLIRYLLTSPEVQPVRRRAVCIATTIALAIVGLIVLMPVPGNVHAVGTLARENDQVVFARSSGFLTEKCDRIGTKVECGALLATLTNVDIACAIQKKLAEIDQLEVRYHRAISDDYRAAAATQQELVKVRAELDQLQEDRKRLDVRSPIRGHITQAEGLRHEGRFVSHGERLALISAGPWVLRTIANADGLTHSPPKVGQQVRIRLAGEGSYTLHGTIVRMARAGSRKIDIPSLTQLAGGQIAVSTDTLEAEEPFFDVSIALSSQDDPMLRHGMTAVVSFGGRRQPIGIHLYRRGLLLLSKLRSAS